MSSTKRTPMQDIPCDKRVTGVAKGKILYLRRDGEGSPGKSCDCFLIRDDGHHGGSCVCYTATLLGEEKTGRLKEFYPTDMEAVKLERSPRNYVLPVSGSEEAFLTAREEFVGAYRTLREIANKSRRSKKEQTAFSGFIPDFSIYYPCDEEGNYVENGTAYIWTPPAELMVFQDYVDEIRKNPTVRPVHKLLTVLNTVKTLAECVSILHEKGLVHLDIKPSNFAIPLRRKELLTDTVTMFDINSFSLLSQASPAGWGTDGFRAPEVEAGLPLTISSDIYSIGCTLFTALMARKDISDDGYDKKYFSKIPRLLEESPLISSSSTNANVYVRHLLASILRKCLDASTRQRYESCSDLARDLGAVMVYLYPSEYSDKLPANKKLAILDRELEQKNESIDLTLLYHLYQNPLYRCVPQDSEELNILVVGFGNYGQRFLDVCLQLGQIPGKKLNVTVVSNDQFKRVGTCPDEQIYLDARPMFKEFFSVNDDPSLYDYGSVRFINREFVKDQKTNQQIAQEIMKESSIQYVFVALGDSKMNKAVAKAFVDVAPPAAELENGTKQEAYSVNFIYSDEPLKGRTFGTPWYVTKDIRKEAAYKEIERMAFNCHMIWEDSLNVSPKLIKDFRKPYNYRSSISNAVSIKYKLYGLKGLSDMDPLANPNEAAALYRSNALGKNWIRNQLVCYEHRRWNVEKICEGWTPLDDEAYWIENGHKNEKEKKHACLVGITETVPLLAWTRAEWDMADEEGLAELDELDRISVRLHQAYKKRADEIRSTAPLFDTAMMQLRILAEKIPSAEIAFSEYYSCLSMLWMGVNNGVNVREYGLLREKLEKAFEALSKEDQVTAMSNIRIMDERFSIIIKSLKYTDFKQTDNRLIERIPFVLTYRKDIHIAVPLCFGDNSAAFQNVAAATALNPHKITYLHYFSEAKEIALFKSAVNYILNYLPEKNVTAQVDFLLACVNDRRNLGAELTRWQDGCREDKRIHEIRILELEPDAFIAKEILDVLDKKDPVAIERNEGKVSNIFLGAGVYVSHAKYCFSPETQRFYEVKGCDVLKYIKPQTYLKVTDMFACKKSKGLVDSPLGFYNDYERLWKDCYREDESAWKKTCAAIREYHNRDCVCAFTKEEIEKKDSFVSCRFLIPTASFAGARKVIDFLKNAEVLEKETSVTYYTPDSCTVDLRAAQSFVKRLKALFTDPGILPRYENLEMLETDRAYQISFSRLRVEGLVLPQNGENKKIWELLQKLEQEFAFITGFACNPNPQNDAWIMSFTYATKRIKRLLTNEGNILEIYAYLKCLQSGYFDDCVTGYEINWDGSKVKNEFDLLVTKGFSSLFIELKATQEIEQNFLHKLKSLATHFAINYKAVLVADTAMDPNSSKGVKNQGQIERGEMMDISVISSKEDIDNIDKTLAKLLQIKIPQKTAAKENNAR